MKFKLDPQKSFAKRSKSSTAGKQPPLSTSAGRDYPGGYTDQDIETIAFEDGSAALHNPTVWGANTKPRTIEVLNRGHDSNAGLISHDYREQVQLVAEDLESALVQAKSTEQDALDDLERHAQDQTAQVRLRNAITSVGYQIPSLRGFFLFISTLALLFTGDLAVLALGFQVLGLSDTPQIPGIQLTDELHLAALASVIGILVAAHFSGAALREITHYLDHRDKNQLPRKQPKYLRWLLPRRKSLNIAPWPKQAVIVGLLAVAFGFALIYGLGALRIEYLNQNGKDAQPWIFLLLQLGVFGAAVLLSYHHENPFARKWAAVCDRTKKSSRAQKLSEEKHFTMVGLVNGKVDLLGMLLANAGHHIGVSRSDVRRQAQGYIRRTTLAQPEPTTERLFPDKLPEPIEWSSDELTKFLTGISPLPSFGHLDTSSVLKRREEIRVQLRNLHAELSGEEVASAKPAIDFDAELDDLMQHDGGDDEVAR